MKFSNIVKNLFDQVVNIGSTYIEMQYLLDDGEDRSSKRDEGFAILNDGSVVQITLKPNIYLDD